MQTFGIALGKLQLYQTRERVANLVIQKQVTKVHERPEGNKIQLWGEAASEAGKREASGRAGERGGRGRGETKMRFSKNMHEPTISDSFKMLLANMAV